MEPDVKVAKSVQTGLRGSAGVQLMPNGKGEIFVGTVGSSSGVLSRGSPTTVPLGAAESSPPLPVSVPTCASVMTDEQLETLRRQISVYATICSQLVEMHKAVMAQQAMMPSMIVGQHLPFDPVLGSRSSGRQRWTPSQIQLQILEKFFEEGNGTPSKQKIKEITAELGNHGQISETNVYNWFQNRKARAKRKQQCLTPNGESELDMEEVESRKDKRAAVDASQDGALTTASRPQADAGTIFDEGFIQGSHRDFSTVVVLIDGKPWEVPSGALDLRGSFGEASALLDSQRQIVPTDETGFTITPLNAGESYTLIRLANDAGQIAPGIVSQQ